MRRVLLLTAPLVAAALHSCDGASSKPSGNTSPVPPGSSASNARVIIIKFVTHPALDATEEGVTAVLKEAIASDPALRHFRIETHNANRNPQLAKQIAENAVQDDVKAIVAIGTPAAQAVARTPSNIPFVYAAVSDPDGAGLLVTGRATGIKNVGPNTIAAALSFMRKAFPNAQRLGTLYNPAEQNSVYVQEILARLAPGHGFELTQMEVHDTSHVSSATELLTDKVDLIYSANDNTVNAAVASAAAVARAKQMPFVLGDLSTLDSGAVAAIGLQYEETGREAGAMVLSLLRGTAVGNLPPKGAPEPEIWLNAASLKAIRLTLSEEAKDQVDRVIGE